MVSLKELDLSFNLLSTVPRGLQSQLIDLRLSSNQLIFIQKDDFSSLKNIQSLDFSFNRLRAIEGGALQFLTNLQELDLSGNNWSCDCYLRDLKSFLSRMPIHRGAQRKLLCGEGGDLAGKEIDQIPESNLRCSPEKFQVENNEIGVATLSWKNLNTPPPYVTFRLNLSGVTDTGKFLF